jgi:diguanylate cyclase (GGDEF)-like protein
MTSNGRRPRPEPQDPALKGESEGGFADRRLADLDQTASDSDQTRADTDQTHSDADQTHSDVDRVVSEADQRLAERDQLASDHDQAAADRSHASDPAGTPDPAYDASRAERADATAERGSNAAQRAAVALTRSREAMYRDDTARLRDVDALARDRTAEARDRAAERQAALAAKGANREAVIEALHASGEVQRKRAAADRARAAADRARAAEDRSKAALDRRQARAALQDAYLDDLTGVYTRRLGLLTVQHEIDRARRSGDALVLAMIDVDGLKQVNDRGGHAAGDTLLRDVATAIRSKVRSYDPVVRMGGDEFICAFPNTALEPATRQMQEMKATLRERQPSSSLSVGLVELRPNETLVDFLARADAELYRDKGRK